MHCPSLSQHLVCLLLKTNLLFLSRALKVFGAFVLPQMRLQRVGLEVDASPRKGGGFFTRQRWEGHLDYSDLLGNQAPELPRGHA